MAVGALYLAVFANGAALAVEAVLGYGGRPSQFAEGVILAALAGVTLLAIHFRRRDVAALTVLAGVVGLGALTALDAAAGVFDPLGVAISGGLLAGVAAYLGFSRRGRVAFGRMDRVSDADLSARRDAFQPPESDMERLS